MRIIFLSVVLACVVALASGMILFSFQRPIYEAQPMPSIRVGDPGENLVGSDWTGNPSRTQRPDSSTLGSGAHDGGTGDGGRGS